MHANSAPSCSPIACSEAAAGAKDTAIAVSATDAGKNHHRPRRSLYAPTSGCAIELVAYHPSASAPWHQAGKPARVTSKKITNGTIPEYKSLAPCANAIKETPRRFHGSGRVVEAVVTAPPSSPRAARLANERAHDARDRGAPRARRRGRRGRGFVPPQQGDGDAVPAGPAHAGRRSRILSRARLRRVRSMGRRTRRRAPRDGRVPRRLGRSSVRRSRAPPQRHRRGAAAQGERRQRKAAALGVPAQRERAAVLRVARLPAGQDDGRPG